MAGPWWQDCSGTLGAPQLGDMVFSPPPAIFLPQLTPRVAGTRVWQLEGCRLSPRWLPGTSGSAGSSAPLPRPHPQGGQRCDVSLGRTDVLLSPGAMGHPWCGVAPFRGVGSPHNHVCKREGCSQQWQGGRDTFVPHRSRMWGVRVRRGGCERADLVPLESSLDPTGQRGRRRGKPVPVAAEPGGPRPTPAMTLLNLWSLCTMGMCRRVGNRHGRALAPGPQVAGGKAETLPLRIPVEPEGHQVTCLFPASLRTGKRLRTSPEHSFVAEAPEKPERLTRVEMLTGVLVGVHKIAPLSFSILAATARAAPCKSETTFSWGDGICCHWRKKSLC